MNMSETIGGRVMDRGGIPHEPRFSLECVEARELTGKLWVKRRFGVGCKSGTKSRFRGCMELPPKVEGLLTLYFTTRYPHPYGTFLQK